MKKKKKATKQKPPKSPTSVEHSEHTTLSSTFAVKLMPNGKKTQTPQ